MPVTASCESQRYRLLNRSSKRGRKEVHSDEHSRGIWVPIEGFERSAAASSTSDSYPAPDEVVVEVAGCGVCHTDVGFAIEGVPTRHPLPLILGHEISGRVVAAGEKSEIGWDDP